MAVTQEILDSLVNAPREALNVEVKRWIDPTTPEGVGKIAIGCMALRNRNGGYLVIGFEDDTLLPSTVGMPTDVRAAFHQDLVQGIVSKYASNPFEVSVGFGIRDGQEFPVISIDSGVMYPVAATRELLNGTKSIIRQHAVYFRTLNASGVPSSAPARHNDWRDIVDICFENREVDIGRFLRRHLGATGSVAFMEMVSSVQERPLRQRTFNALTENEERAFARISDTHGGKDIIAKGYWSVLLKIDPPLDGNLPAVDFLNIISSANPNYTGWPVWLDSRGFREEQDRPKYIKKHWESLILDLSEGWGGGHADFYRIGLDGDFYLWRVLQDDLSPDKIKPGKVFDPALMIYRVVETLVVAIAFAKALGRGEGSTLSFAFKWGNLEGREIQGWADRLYYFSPHGIAMGNEAEGYVEIPADTPLEAVAPFAKQATRDLFDLWNGWDFPMAVIEQHLERLLSRRM